MNIITALFTNNFFESSDILEKADFLLKFADSLENTSSKEEHIKIFFVKLHLMYEKILMNTEYLYTKQYAVDNYLYLRLYSLDTLSVEDFIENIRKIGNSIKNEFTKKANSNIISVKKLNSILSYLDEKYNFFCGFETIEFSIMEYENKNYNSLLLIEKEAELSYNFFFFNVKRKVAPEYIVFHELGHFLHSNCTNGKLNLIKKIYEPLKNAGMDIKNATLYEQKEFIADILATGLMYQSPYEKYIPFNFLEEHKLLFKEIAEKITNNLNESI